MVAAVASAERCCQRRAGNSLPVECLFPVSRTSPPTLDCWRKTWKREGTAENGETDGEGIYICPHSTGRGSFNVPAIVVCVCVCFASRPSLLLFTSNPGKRYRKINASHEVDVRRRRHHGPRRKAGRRPCHVPAIVGGGDRLYKSPLSRQQHKMTGQTNARSTVPPVYACPHPTPPSQTSGARTLYATRAAARASRASAPSRPGRQ